MRLAVLRRLITMEEVFEVSVADEQQDDEQDLRDPQPAKRQEDKKSLAIADTAEEQSMHKCSHCGCQNTPKKMPPQPLSAIASTEVATPASPEPLAAKSVITEGQQPHPPSDSSVGKDLCRVGSEREPGSNSDSNHDGSLEQSSLDNEAIESSAVMNATSERSGAGSSPEDDCAQTTSQSTVIASPGREDDQEPTSSTRPASALRVLPKWVPRRPSAAASTPHTASKLAKAKRGYDGTIDPMSKKPRLVTLQTPEGLIDVTVLPAKAELVPNSDKKYRCPVKGCQFANRTGSRVYISKHFMKEHPNYRSFRDLYLNKDAPQFVLKDVAADEEDDVDVEEISEETLQADGLKETRQSSPEQQQLPESTASPEATEQAQQIGTESQTSSPPPSATQDDCNLPAFTASISTKTETSWSQAAPVPSSASQSPATGHISAFAAVPQQQQPQAVHRPLAQPAAAAVVQVQPAPAQPLMQLQYLMPPQPSPASLFIPQSQAAQTGFVTPSNSLTQPVLHPPPSGAITLQPAPAAAVQQPQLSGYVTQQQQQQVPTFMVAQNPQQQPLQQPQPPQQFEAVEADGSVQKYKMIQLMVPSRLVPQLQSGSIFNSPKVKFVPVQTVQPPQPPPPPPPPQPQPMLLRPCVQPLVPAPQQTAGYLHPSAVPYQVAAAGVPQVVQQILPAQQQQQPQAQALQQSSVGFLAQQARFVVPE